MSTPNTRAIRARAAAVLAAGPGALRCNIDDLLRELPRLCDFADALVEDAARDEERLAAMQAKLDEARAVLRKLEWSDDGRGIGDECPVCHEVGSPRDPVGAHDASCALKLALADAASTTTTKKAESTP